MNTDIELPGTPRPADTAVITVGTFDGVHRGHRAVLDRLRETGHAHGLQSLVVTFDPHPLRVVRPDAAPSLLTNTQERVELLRASGVDEVAVVPFTRALSQLSPRDFVERVLIRHFGLAHLVIGHDHGFGRDRSGDVDTLREIGAELGFGVTVVPPTIEETDPISSTRIRRLLAAGDVVEAARLLGRPYSASGTVVRGDGRGRELGFPTANLRVEPDKLLPHEGIYAVRASLADGSVQNGVVHLGPRPTFDGAAPTFELFLLDYSGDLYEQRIAVRFCAWLRAIERYAGIEPLIAAMRADVERTRVVLSAGPSACQDLRIQVS